MKQTYNITHNVGRVKYLVSYYTGERSHPDGSLAMDIAIFRNKKKLRGFEKQLLSEGYQYKY